jgi:hypothetical protein
MADTIATAADYADAMMTARTAKTGLFLLLLLILVTQVSLFIVTRYTSAIFPQPAPAGADAIVAPTTETATPDASVELAVSTTQPTAGTTSGFAADFVRYVIGATDFLGIVISVVFSAVLFLIVMIMLVGRLIGVSRVTSAFIWSIVLAVLLFPWQAFLDPMEFKIPGVLYTWRELAGSGRFPGEFTLDGYLKWARFVGFPVVAAIVLLYVQGKSQRGLKQALGEATPDTSAGLA